MLFVHDAVQPLLEEEELDEEDEMQGGSCVQLCPVQQIKLLPRQAYNPLQSTCLPAGQFSPSFVQVQHPGISTSAIANGEIEAHSPESIFVAGLYPVVISSHSLLAFLK